MIRFPLRPIQWSLVAVIMMVGFCPITAVLPPALAPHVSFAEEASTFGAEETQLPDELLTAIATAPNPGDSDSPPTETVVPADSATALPDAAVTPAPATGSPTEAAVIAIPTLTPQSIPTPDPAVTSGTPTDLAPTVTVQIESAANPTPAKLTIGSSSGRVGETIPVSVFGFAANKRVAIYFDSARKATLVTDGTGTASGSIRLTATAAGLHEIRATGGGLSISKKFRIRPVLTLSVTIVQAGKPVIVTLTGFAASVKVKIRLYDIDGSSTLLSLWTPTTDATGGSSNSFTTKSTLPPGEHKLVATDSAGNSTSVYLTTTAARPKPPKPDNSSVSQVYTRGTSGRNEVALTFDAGADRGYAEKILNILKQYGIRASFGITGHWAEENPDLVTRMVNEGHMVFNHTWTHRSFTGASSPGAETAVLTTAGRRKEIDDTAVIIGSLTNGYEVKPYFRPPYGDTNSSVLRDVAAAGYSITVMWTCDSLGWNGASVYRIIERCGYAAEAGDIILMHVGARSLDAAALPGMIEALQDQGFALVTVEELLQP